jgi:hypothetical protein
MQRLLLAKRVRGIDVRDAKSDAGISGTCRIAWCGDAIARQSQLQRSASDETDQYAVLRPLCNVVVNQAKAQDPFVEVQGTIKLGNLNADV